MKEKDTCVRGAGLAEMYRRVNLGILKVRFSNERLVGKHARNQGAASSTIPMAILYFHAYVK